MLNTEAVLKEGEKEISIVTGQNFRQCSKINEKIHKLTRMGKLSLSGCSIQGKDILNLGKGYFGASNGCKKSSGKVSVSEILTVNYNCYYADNMVSSDYLDDYLVTTDDMMNSTQTGIYINQRQYCTKLT